MLEPATTKKMTGKIVFMKPLHHDHDGPICGIETSGQAGVIQLDVPLPKFLGEGILD